MSVMTDKLLEKFGKGILHNSACYLPRQEDTLRKMVTYKGMKFPHILEIGTYQGVSTAVLAEYADDVDTFDVRDDLLIKDEIWDFLGCKNKITFFTSRGNKEKELKFRDELLRLLVYQADFVFVDGEHNNGWPERDYEIVKKCPYILYHDYGKIFPEVKQLCDKTGRKVAIENGFCLLGPKRKQNV